MKKLNQDGFTLLELVIVILIISILAVIGVTFQLSNIRRARDARRKSDLQEIRIALAAYFTDKKSYPSTTEGITVLSPDYIKAVPHDPKSGHPDYNYTSDGYTYVIYATLENSNDADYPEYTVSVQ